LEKNATQMAAARSWRLTFIVLRLHSSTSDGAQPPSPDGAFVEKVKDVSSSSNFLERPMSDTLTWLSPVRRMLRGLMSQWTTPSE